MNQNLAKHAVEQYLAVAQMPSTEQEWDQWRAQWLSLYRDSIKVDIFNYARSLPQTPIVSQLIQYLSESSSPEISPVDRNGSRFIPAPLLPIAPAVTGTQGPNSPARERPGSPQKHYFKPGTQLSEREQAFCRCEVHIMEKNTQSCEKSDLGEKGCINPFALCRRTGGYNQECGENFDFDAFSDSELGAYVRQRIGPVNGVASRQELLNMIRTWKSQGR